MRRTLTAIGLGLLLLAAAHAGGVRVAGPVVLVEPASTDFGALPQGVIRSVDVTVRNEGTEMLRILGVESDCGCTVARLPDSTLAPGESTVLHVDLSTHATSGSLSKHVFLRTNDPAAPRATVTLKALVRAPISCRPTTLDYGTLSRGASRSDTLRIKVARTDPLTIDSLSFPAALVTAATGQRAEGDSLVYEVYLRLRPDAPPGPFRATGRVFTNHRLAREVSVQLQGQISAAFRVDPANFAFGQLREGTARERRVRVTAVSGARRVTGAVCSDARLTATVVPVREGEIYDVVLALPATLPRGSLRAEVRVTTDDPAQPEIVLPVVGVVRRGPS